MAPGTGTRSAPSAPCETGSAALRSRRPSQRRPPMPALTVSSGSAICHPGEAGYDEAVRIWNAAIARRPSVVVRCATAEDVSAALAHAAAESLEVSVRGGGHAYSGSALTDGGLMIDLTPMKAVVIDVDARR